MATLPVAREVAPRATFAVADAGEVALDYEARHRRRIAMRTSAGLDFLLNLARTQHLRDGDGLVLEDGRIVAVRARAEPLLEVRAKDSDHAVRLAWHVGNRHLPAALGAQVILVRADPVIADMLRGLGADVREVLRPFDPEPGAYAAPRHAHAHD